MIDEINETLNQLRAKAKGTDLVVDVEQPRNDRNEFMVYCREASEKFHSVHYTLVKPRRGESLVDARLKQFKSIVNRIIDAKKVDAQ